MIQRTEIKGVHYTVDEKIRRYVERKLGGLDGRMSRHSRDSAHLEVVLKEPQQKGPKTLECHAMLHLPHETISVAESTVNMYAAVDIVEAKLKAQLKKYKEMHERSRFSRKLLVKRQPQAL